MREIDGALVTVASTAKVAETLTVKGIGRVILGQYVTVEDNVLFDTGSSPDASIVIGDRTKIKHGAVLRTYDGEIVVGARSSVGEYSILAGHGGLQIASTVIIAGHCYFSAADHIFEGKVEVRFQGEVARGIQVGEGAWFGARCVVLDGVAIGAGCVVGAGSVVTKSLRANMLCLGTPCRELRSRIPKEDHNDW